MCLHSASVPPSVSNHICVSICLNWAVRLNRAVRLNLSVCLNLSVRLNLSLSIFPSQSFRLNLSISICPSQSVREVSGKTTLKTRKQASPSRSTALNMHRMKLSVEKQTHPYSPRRRQKILQIIPKIRTMDVQNGMEKRHGKEREN